MHICIALTSESTSCAVFSYCSSMQWSYQKPTVFVMIVLNLIVHVLLALWLVIRMFSTNILNVVILLDITHTVICLNLESLSFALTSKISVLENGYDRKYLPKVVVHETYSAKQYRARLDYEIMNAPEQEEKLGQVYFDPLSGITLLHDRTRDSCKLIDLNELDKILGLINLKLLQSDDLQSNRLLGAARLLLFIENKKDKLVPVNTSVLDRIEQSEYKLCHGQLSLTIFYHNFKKKELHEGSTPFQVLVDSPNASLAIDYSPLRPMREDKEELGLLDGDPNFNEADHFALPKVVACISVLSGKMKPLFGNPKMNRISFDSKMSQLLDDGSTLLDGPELSVAYDAQLRSLRLDTINVRQPAEATSLKSSRKVVNFKTRRVYQIYEEHSLLKADNQLLKSDCRVLKMYGNSERITMGNLLTGADFFVYLGRAQVRGHIARLYAALSGTQPAWLEQTLEYTTGDGKARMRDPRQGLVNFNRNGSVGVTYLYVSEHEMPQLIAMEISNQFGNKILLEFFNFVWRFDSLKWSSNMMFSLSEFCSSRDGEHYARAELLLEKSDRPPWRQVLTRQERDPAILVALQDFFSLPVNMVFDLETRALADNRFLFAQFHVATHTSAQVELVYLGRGYLVDESHTEGALYRARSFQSCLQAAITAKSNNFGYNIQTQLCFNYGKTTPKGQSNGFELEPDGQMEFYLLKESKQFQLDRDYNSKGRWIESSTRSFTKRQLLSSRVFLRAGATGLAWFTVKRLEISELNSNRQEEDITVVNGESGEEVESPDKFEGFGLTEEEEVDGGLPVQRRVSEKKLGEVGGLAQCRWACLLDTSCQSYSVCHRRHELQCATSRLNFRSSNVSRQLREALKQVTSKLVLVQLENSSEPLKLVKHPSCTLYNKVHLDLFARKGLYMRSASGSQLVGAWSREDCAKQCAAMSAKVLVLDSSLSKEWSLHNRRQQVDNSQHAAGSSSKFQELFEARRLNGLQFCQSFHYIDKSQLDDTTLATVPEDTVEGYCLFSSRNQVSKSSVGNETLKPMTFELYQIELINFYERQNGLRLKASRVEPDEQVLYRKAKIGYKLNEEEIERLAGILKAGHNFHEVIYADEAKCADICFGGAIGQAMRPWPGCRSFDLELDERQANSPSAIRCHLNSMSLEDALLHNRLDLVDETGGAAPANPSESLISFSHFELRHGMLVGATAGEQVAGLVKLEQLSHSGHMGALAQSSFLVFGSLALICGFLLAHLYDKHLQQRSRSAEESVLEERELSR